MKIYIFKPLHSLFRTFYIMITLALSPLSQGFCQEDFFAQATFDTIQVKAKSTIIFQNKSVYFPRDTLILIPPGTKYTIKTKSNSNSQQGPRSTENTNPGVKPSVQALVLF